MRRTAFHAVVLMSGLAFASMASASTAGTSLSVKFENSPNPMTATTSAGVVPTVNWNLADTATGTLGSLNEDTAGTAVGTSASVSWSAQSTVQNTNNNGFPQTINAFNSGNSGDQKLMLGALNNQSTSVASTISITNLPSNLASGYSLYLYSDDPINNRAGSYTVNGNTELGVSTSSAPSNQYIQGDGVTPSPGNYLLFSGLSGTTLNISFVGYTGSFSSYVSSADVQGIELVPASVPEPASLGLLSCAAVGLLARRRRA